MEFYIKAVWYEILYKAILNVFANYCIFNIWQELELEPGEARRWSRGQRWDTLISCYCAVGIIRSDMVCFELPLISVAEPEPVELILF